MKPVHRLRADPVETAPSGRGTLIDRYLGIDARARRVTYSGIPDDHRLSRLGVTLFDTTGEPATVPLPEHVPVIWHVLWTRDEAGSTVTVSSPDRTGTWPIAPGDSVPVPRGASLLAHGGQLALAITVPDDDTESSPPTHGSDRFAGHNRHTAAFATSRHRVSRWKVTQPLALGDHVDAPCLMMALARDVVIRTPTTIDPLRQGQMAIIDPRADPVIMPDGLGYLLTIEATASD